jgi:L-galactose dehydrogenase
MQYRPLGRTGLNVSVIGFGASPLGNEFGPADFDEGLCAVHLAIERGINFFDVSPSMAARWPKSGWARRWRAGATR